MAARGNGCENAMTDKYVCRKCEGFCEGFWSEWYDNGAVLTTQTVMNVSPDSIGYQNCDSGFGFQECDCRIMVNEGDYHGEVVV